ncbi:response regulator [Megasphaera sp. AM44-1BH]|jgi:two-component system response regulator YesN|uniref:response regulator transcription factor n=1 Tax=Megasphaera sp. AM44-1BH TaxID=2292358 RepID=UPI000E550013|nr:response regulator [Megasphaera sp. AM44-1BH]RHA09222.1 response regulator [Megasphaera sp. AM44-1BH]
MYNLVIADDEQLVFQYIQAVIEKNHLPLHICGTASNGKEALRLVQIYQPEFVMLDINMPEINGLDVAEKIREANPDTFIYILTAYKEFEYAHRAMHARVTDYLVKPIKPHDLVRILKAGIGQALKMRIDKTHLEQVEKKLEEQYPVVIKEQLAELLRIGSRDEKVLPLLCSLSHRKNFKPIAVCAIGGWHDNENGNSVPVRIHGGAFRKLREYAVIIRKGDLQVCIFDRWNSQIRCMLQSMIETYETDYNVSLSAVVYMKHEEMLSFIYKRAVENCYIGMFWQLKRFIILGACKTKTIADNSQLDLTHTYEQFQQFLLDNDLSSGKKFICDIFQEMQRLEYPRNLLLVNIIRFGCDLLDRYGRNVLSDEEVIRAKKKYISDINNTLSAQAALTHVNNLIDMLTYDMVSTQNNADKVVESVLEYIEANYDKELTLDQITKEYFVSKGYFCRVFKKYTGKRFVSYLTEVRMKKARELLSSGKYTITEVAGRIGFKDASYFSTVFRKFYSCSPSDVLPQNKMKETSAASSKEDF